MLTPKNIKNIYPLSPMQEGMYFHALADPASPAYFEQVSYRLEGTLHLAQVEKSVGELFRRHDILRTVFTHRKADRPLQVVLRERVPAFYFEDLRDGPDCRAAIARADAYKRADRERPFDLGRDVLMRVAVFRLAEGQYEFVWSHHHILMDGWCSGLLIGEFSEIYRSLLHDKAPRLPPVTPYHTYIEWLEKRDRSASAHYWKQYLQHYEQVAAVPRRTGGPGGGYCGGSCEWSLDQPTTERVEKLAARYQVTLNTLVETLWGIVLAKYNDRCDVVFGAVVSGRPSEIPGVETMAGLFINTIPVRICFGEDERFADLLKRTQQRALESLPHHYYPLAKVQSESPLRQDLLDHILVFENYPVSAQLGSNGKAGAAAGVRISHVEAVERTHYPWSLTVLPGTQLGFKIQYDAARYEARFVERVRGHFRTLIRQVCTDPDSEIAALTLLTAEEQQDCLARAAHAAVAYPAGLSGIPGGLPGALPTGPDRTGYRVYLLDAHLQLVPAGVAGEICVGGPGVARGCLDGAASPAGNFVDDPFCPGERLYRTGDLGRWREDGNVEYLGRLDHPGKDRGCRVETGEIESRLRQHPAVQQAVVVARQTQPGRTQLVAYLVPRAGVPAETDEIRAFLRETLPAYLVPACVVKLECLPLTPGGQVDHQALPVPDRGPAVRNAFAAPATPLEALLVAIWQEVLGKEAVSVEACFFSLGGDSIKTIQIASRLRKAGYELAVRDVFTHSSIRQLAPRIQPAQRKAEQGIVRGNVPLTPVQREFFATPYQAPHHFNHAAMLYAADGFAEAALRAVFTKLIRHHDALRMRYPAADGAIGQVNDGADGPVWLQTTDLRREADPAAALALQAERLQAGFDLAHGPLFKLGLFHLPDGDRLLIVVHHLVMDAVSWYILSEDIHTLYRQYQQGETLALPPKTDSFQQWAKQLQAYAGSDALLREKAYWQACARADLPRIAPEAAALATDSAGPGRTCFGLDGPQTEALVRQGGRGHQAGTQAVLLAALAVSLRTVLGLEQTLVSVVSHGREAAPGNLDISRTVGWFTTSYPLVIDAADGTPATILARVQRSLAAVPNGGIGYGILKYLTAPADKADVAFWWPPQVSFNYLGEFDSNAIRGSFGPAKEGPGNVQAEVDRHQARHLLQVSAVVTDKKLRVDLVYNQAYFLPGTVGRLQHCFRRELVRLGDAHACREPEPVH